ncbi:signal recognition particle protein [Acetobacterium carbinolicum]|jgi:signal recognition particle subunit SRP54|uniref:signal recognition particle protein n=1 Tax=Acetobacterium TaxID=33951 RepID=UPI000DBEC03F|nr:MULTISPECIES: signal recognition particle protein [unclassified Acetobacterium]AWW25405.1 signal recognition particle protein [Acetobacterium sp. KB-1]MDZ5723919.1 signal recognition particle protein [Acetobacterium sp. K1/6]
MIFEGLNEKFQNIFSQLKRKGKLNEKDIQEVNREIKMALLEADVNFKVVKQFTKNIGERAIGQEVLSSLTPGQQFIKIVKDEMTTLLGGEIERMDFIQGRQNVYMMVGLQGAGKTTTAAKLANLLRKEKKFKPLLVACDVYRPAAIKQLEILGDELKIDVYSEHDIKDPVGIAKRGLKKAVEGHYDLVVMDTAGRLQIDEALMDELVNIKEVINPTEILLTVDGMTGQESVNVANEFNRLLDISGVILTKLDGDTRGGAALSITYTIGKAIKYIGTGEKLTDIELFYPDRMASRILGMGDVLSFIDKAQSMMDDEKAKELEEKFRNQDFDLNDFLDQIRQIESMGSISSLLEMMPGASKKAMKNVDLSGADTKKTEAIILSMTKEERHKPGIINASRRRRIALGSGTMVADVNRLLKGFEQSKKMMKQMSNPNMAKKGRMKLPFM